MSHRGLLGLIVAIGGLLVHVTARGGEDDSLGLTESQKSTWKIEIDKVRRHFYVEGNAPIRLSPQIQSICDKADEAIAANLKELEEISKKAKRDAARLQHGPAATEKSRYAQRVPLLSKAKESEDLRRELTAKLRELKKANHRAIVGVPLHLSEGSIGEMTQVRVLQVVDKNSLIGVYEEQAIWIDEINTKGVTDDSIVKTSGLIFLVDGTKSYTNGFNVRRTIRRVRAIDLHQYEQMPSDDQMVHLLERSGMTPADFLKRVAEAKQRDRANYVDLVTDEIDPPDR